MRTGVPSLLAGLALLLAIPLRLDAQEPAPAAPTTPADISVPSPPPTAAAGGYSYIPQGRRDPFVSLLKPVTADQGPGKRPPGINGFLIQEVALKGIVKDSKGKVIHRTTYYSNYSRITGVTLVGR